ncbi:polysaccharide deacetylase family protein [Candidatus Sumerlaeota bacterium]|nr:polysaccharide deacetylase family protein [Candidatus Sumerlaeota bacterium]
MNEPSPEPIVLLYHGLDPGDGRYADVSPGAQAYVVSRGVFERHGAALIESRRRVVDPLERFTRGLGSGMQPGEAILTFDDGLRSDYEVAFRLLREWDCRAIFFVNPAMVGTGERVGWTELSEMVQAGMAIGSHGLTHEFLSGMSPERQRRTLSASMRRIEERVGGRVRALSLPGGRWGRRTLEIARECGYTAVYTSSPQPAVLREGIWVVGRVAVRNGWSGEFFRNFLENQEAHLRRMRRADTIRRAAQRLLGDGAYERAHKALWAVRGTRSERKRIATDDKA